MSRQSDKLHVPTRRENFNSFSSVVLGTESGNQTTRPGYQQLFDREQSKPVSKQAHRPRNSMAGILNPRTSRAVKENNSVKSFDTVS